MYPPRSDYLVTQKANFVVTLGGRGLITTTDLKYSMLYYHDISRLIAV